MREDIDQKLKEILEGYVGKQNVEAFWKTGQNAFFTGEPWNMTAIEMTYFFLDVEKVFQIRIDASMIRKYEFASVKGVRKCIKKYMIDDH